MEKELEKGNKLLADMLLDVLTSLYHCLSLGPSHTRSAKAMVDYLHEYIALFDEQDRPKSIKELVEKIDYKFPYTHYRDNREYQTDNYKNAYAFVVPLTVRVQKKYIDIYKRYFTAIMEEIQDCDTKHIKSSAIYNELEEYEEKCKRIFNTNDIEYIRKALKIDKYLNNLNKA